jgi:hypothetical protein
MLFAFKRKKKEGHFSKIAKLDSPYLRKTTFSKKSKFITESRKAKILPPARIKPPSNRWKKILAAILTTGILIFLIYAFFFADYFVVRNYKVEEKGVIIESNNAINTILSSRTGQNLTLLNTKKLTDEIRAAQPEIKNLSIKKIFPDTIIAQYEKFPTVANITNIVNGIQKNFLVDSQGFLTEENSDNPNLPYIKIETAKPIEVRNTFLGNSKTSAERLTYILNAINLFEEKFGIKVLYAQLKQREREVHLYTEKYFYVMLDMQKDLRSQLEKLKKALPKLDIYTVPLLYIDLRISGSDFEKVIYKRKKT